MKLTSTPYINYAGIQNTGEQYYLDETPITMSQYIVKCNYKSYFALMGIPYKVSEAFHKHAYNLDIEEAVSIIKPFFATHLRNLRLIKKHLSNAKKRVLN